MEMAEFTDLAERLDEAIQGVTTGNFREGSKFSKFLAAFKLVPPGYSKIAWTTYLLAEDSATGKTDFERYGLPVLKRSIGAHLQGNGADARSIVKAIEAAIQSARDVRRDARTRPTDGSTRIASSTAKPFAALGASLEERVDDALSLLEGATRANHLLGRQRARILRLAEMLGQGRQPHICPDDPSMSRRGGLRSEKRPGTVQDGAADWFAGCRDNGQFGSHPAYDDMDDESSA